MKHYCTYDKTNRQFTMLPYNQLTTKVVSTPDKMILSTCFRRMSESIEKRFCFDIQVEDRPSIVYTFQALNEEDRKSWLDIMDGKEPVSCLILYHLDEKSCVSHIKDCKSKVNYLVTNHQVTAICTAYFKLRINYIQSF